MQQYPQFYPAPQSNGGSGVAIGIGVTLLLVVGAGVGYYLYDKSKKEQEAKMLADQAAAEAAEEAASTPAQVPLMKDGKQVKDAKGNPVMVAAPTTTATVTKDGKPAPATQNTTAPAVEAAPEPAKSNKYVFGETIDMRNNDKDTAPYSQSSPSQGAFTDKIKEVFDIVPRITIGKKTQKVSDVPAIGKLHPEFKKRRKKAEAEAAAKLADTEKYVRGFMKGMNIALRPEYVGAYSQALKDYMNNPAKIKEENVSKVGDFLTAK